MTTLATAIGGEKNVIGGPFGSKLTKKDYVDDGVPVIRGSNMTGPGRQISGEFAFVSEEKVEADLESNLARPGDIIVTQRGTLGQVAVIPESAQYSRYVVSQSQMAVRVDPGIANRDFVYYHLRSPSFEAYVNASTIQTGVPHINLGILRRCPVSWPPLAVQARIASVLRVLDEKIENNNRMNATLYASAQAIFKDWFVEYGPTRAKARRQQPYLDSSIWDLFPEALDNEQKPSGWMTQQLGQHFRLQKGISYKGKFLHESGMPMINLGCFLGRGQFDASKLKGYVGDHKDRHIVVPGTLVLANTDMTQKRVVLGSPHIVEAESGHSRFLISHHVFAARPLSETSNAWKDFFYFHLTQPEFRRRAEGFATGTTVLALPRDAVEGCAFPMPSTQLYQAFLDVVTPLLKRISLNRAENQRLFSTRDFLLPRLMSGEVHVTDAEPAMEALT